MQKPIDWPALAKKLAGSLTDDLAGELAKALGLPRAALEALPLGYDPNGPKGPCWTIPEEDGAGNIIGIATRYRNGSKGSAPGSKRGLTVPKDWRGCETSLLIPEGASDTLALTAAAVSAVGRFNSTGGADLLAQLLADWPTNKDIIVLGENDPKANGRWPGREGAVRVATDLGKMLGRPVLWALPPDGAKDVRAWLLDHVPEAVRECADAWHDAGDKLVKSLQPIDPAAGQKANGITPPLTWEPFPVDMLPPAAADFVRAAAAALGCDPAYIALPVLAALASAVGNSRTVRLKGTWHEPAILWTCIVGESGTLKSPAYQTATSPLYSIQKQLLNEYRAKAAAYSEEEAEYKARKKRADAEKFDPGRPPEKPVLHRVICSDTTIEKLAAILEENPRGPLLGRNELAAWFGSFTRYKGKAGGTDLQHWLEAWEGRPWIIDRKTPERPTLFIPRAGVSVTGSIQPAILARHLTPEFFESGLVSRLLLAWPPRKRKRWSEAEVAEEVTAGYVGLLESLLKLRMGKDPKGELAPVEVRMDGEAKAEWKAFYNEWAREQEEAEGELAAALAKLEGMAGRLALIHHLAAHGAAEDGDKPPAMTAASVRAGVALVKWFAHEARRVYAMLAESADQRETRQLVEHIAARGGSVTVRDLQRANSRKYPNSEAAEAALAKLVAAGLARRTEGPAPPGGGHRPAVYELNPTERGAAA